MRTEKEIENALRSLQFVLSLNEVIISRDNLMFIKYSMNALKWVLEEEEK